MPQPEQTIYAMVGGDSTFQKLVDIFYARVVADDKLREMFPDDIEPGKHWQFLFLTQYFGGPHRYADERGHPRLRMRHQPFLIDTDARDRWLQYMLAAIDEVGIREPARGVMREYFERAAAFMVNAESSAENIMQWRGEHE
ncbi:MAG: globin [Anaerolineaceae bacterium]|nr:globin [Anaerolineaceae bacterium]